MPYMLGSSVEVTSIEAAHRMQRIVSTETVMGVESMLAMQEPDAVERSESEPDDDEQLPMWTAEGRDVDMTQRAGGRRMVYEEVVLVEA